MTTVIKRIKQWFFGQKYDDKKLAVNEGNLDSDNIPIDFATANQTKKQMVLESSKKHYNELVVQQHKADVIQWRDNCVSNVSIHLLDKFPHLVSVIKEDIEGANFFETRFKKDKINERIDAHFQEWLTIHTNTLIEAANQKLSDINGTLQLVENESTEPLVENITANFEKSNVEFLKGSGLSAAGAGIIVAVPSISTISAGGIAGFFGATVISGPIAIAGLVAGVGALGYGIFTNSKAKEELISSLIEHYHVVVFESEESVCSKIEMLLNDTYKKRMTDLV